MLATREHKKSQKNDGLPMIGRFSLAKSQRRQDFSNHWKNFAPFFQCLEEFFPRVGKDNFASGKLGELPLFSNFVR